MREFADAAAPIWLILRPRARACISCSCSSRAILLLTLDLWIFNASAAKEKLASEATYAKNAEIDEIRWLPIPEAVKLLSYGHDRPVVLAFSPLDDQ